ncbi:MAG: hypothetical protein ACON4N_01730 [Myxococcota bacterium]
MWTTDAVLRWYDELVSHQRLEQLEHLAVRAAIVGLMAHAGFIAIGRVGLLPPAMSEALGTSFLSALYTPFSFILLYEVLLLVLALPESMTMSLGKQYEIVSLIVLRSVFKDIATFDGLSSLGTQFSAFTEVLVDMAGGLMLFFLVGVFYHVNRRHPLNGITRDALVTTSPDVQRFIRQKKLMALGLAALLGVLAAGWFAGWTVDATHVLATGQPPRIDVESVFYVDLFTVMIFIDVLVLLLSMRQNNTYSMVFRNAGFVVSTVLLRFSLTLKNPFDVELAVLAVLFGVIISAVFRYWQWLGQMHTRAATSDVPLTPPS